MRKGMLPWNGSVVLSKSLLEKRGDEHERHNMSPILENRRAKSYEDCVVLNVLHYLSMASKTNETQSRDENITGWYQRMRLALLLQWLSTSSLLFAYWRFGYQFRMPSSFHLSSVYTASILHTNMGIESIQNIFGFLFVATMFNAILKVVEKFFHQLDTCFPCNPYWASAIYLEFLFWPTHDSLQPGPLPPNPASTYGSWSEMIHYPLAHLLKSGILLHLLPLQSPKRPESSWLELDCRHGLYRRIPDQGILLVNFSLTVKWWGSEVWSSHKYLSRESKFNPCPCARERCLV